MTPFLYQRLKIAEQATVDLATEHPGAEIWLVGAIAEHLAHARSDIDLRVVVPQPPAPELRSRLIDGIRVDPAAWTARDVADVRALLASFTVTRDNIEVFRTVRARLPELTAYRTAMAIRNGAFTPVADPAERDGYRKWAVADQAEAAASQAEDLVGLLHAEFYPAATIVWKRFTTTLDTAQLAAAGAPLLDEKWLPALQSRFTPPKASTPPSLPNAVPDWSMPSSYFLCFASAQQRLTQALLRCWPISADPDRAIDQRLTEFGWLPQRYRDGWFLRRGDVRVPVSDGELLGWREQIATNHTPVSDASR